MEPGGLSDAALQEVRERRHQGPTSGVVIQLVRGAEKDKSLTSGDISVGYPKDNLAMKAFVKAVWKALRSLNSTTLCGCDPKTRKESERDIKEYIVGPGARQLSLDGGLLKRNDVDVYYKVESSES